jgi:hypothetical protein
VHGQTAKEHVYFNDSLVATEIPSATPPGNVAPTADGMSPNSGGGPAETFHFNYSDANGASTLSQVRVRFNFTSSDANGCSFIYYPGTNQISLYNDAGSAIIGTITGGGAPNVGNSYCTLVGASVEKDVVENTLRLQVGIGFSTSWLGTKNVYLYAQDSSGSNSGWHARGTWSMNSPNSPPTMGFWSPSSGSGAGQSFTVTAQDANGATDINQMQFIIATSVTSVNSCHFFYFRNSSRFVLIANDGVLWAGVGLPNTYRQIENGQCRLSMLSTSASSAGTTVTVVVRVDFKSGYSGVKNLYGFAADIANSTSGYQYMGYYTATP